MTEPPAASDAARAPAVFPSDNATPADRLIVALDVPSAPEALTLADELRHTCRWVKVGMELYFTTGNAIIQALRARGFHVFLDLKLHDIPNTVAAAVRSVSGTGASLLTVHAGGGSAMLRAAAEAASSPGAPRLLAVTVLTSLDADQLQALGVANSPGDQALRLAQLARASGIPDLVCSAQEVEELRRDAGPASLLVIPGIRPLGADLGDQRRTATPAEALRHGASMLVVGRPITQSRNPAEAARSILHEMAGS